jgi:uncharacterized protein
MTKPIRILSIDGGGIRGIIPAVVLSEIEKQTGKPIASLFDLIAGTSTGGIIALGLVKPDDRGRPHHTAGDLVRLYEEHGKDIFYSMGFAAIQAVRSLFEEKYDAAALEAILRRYFGSTYLHEALTPTIITSYEIERRLAFFFKSRHAKIRTGYDFLMRDVARATSAAPTYFEPAKIKMPDISDYFALVDGGVYANNPAMCAYVEARSMWPEATEFILVSLGTGELTKRIRYDDARGWGVTQWARPILNVVFDGIGDTVDYQLDKLLAPYNGFQRYYRFQARLDEDSEALDNASAQNIRNLKLIGEDLVRQNSHIFRLLLGQLTHSKM